MLYSKTKRFIKKIDYICIKSANTIGIVYMLNYQYF